MQEVKMSAYVTGSRTPAADERGHELGRQASEKPRGRKPRDGLARWRTMEIVAFGGSVRLMPPELALPSGRR